MSFLALYSHPSSSLQVVSWEGCLFHSAGIHAASPDALYLPVIGRDLVAYVTFRALVLPMTIYVNGIVPGYHGVPANIANWPLALRVLLYFILADFGHYWVHRLTHTRYLAGRTDGTMRQRTCTGLAECGPPYPNT